MKGGREMGYKHHGGHHRGGRSYPDRDRTSITIRKEDYEAIRSYAEKNNLSMTDTVTLIVRMGTRREGGEI